MSVEDRPSFAAPRWQPELAPSRFQSMAEYEKGVTEIEVERNPIGNEPLGIRLRKGTMIVDGVDEGSVADKAGIGLCEGYHVTHINGKHVLAVSDLTDVLSQKTNLRIRFQVNNTSDGQVNAISKYAAQTAEGLRGRSRKLQHNQEFYTEELLKKRLALRNSETFQNSIKLLWETIHKHARGIDKAMYMTLFFMLGTSSVNSNENSFLRQVIPKSPQKSELIKTLDKEWEYDSQGIPWLDLQTFSDSIFDLVDMWVDSVELNQYCKVVGSLNEWYTSAPLPEPSPGEWWYTYRRANCSDVWRRCKSQAANHLERIFTSDPRDVVPVQNLRFESAAVDGQLDFKKMELKTKSDQLVALRREAPWSVPFDHNYAKSTRSSKNKQCRSPSTLDADSDSEDKDKINSSRPGTAKNNTRRSITPQPGSSRRKSSTRSPQIASEDGNQKDEESLPTERLVNRRRSVTPQPQSSTEGSKNLGTKPNARRSLTPLSSKSQPNFAASLVLVIQGKKFPITSEIISRYPESMFGFLGKPGEELPVDRNSEIFNIFYEFLTSGSTKLMTVDNAPLVLDEFTFWGLSIDEILPQKEMILKSGSLKIPLVNVVSYPKTHLAKCSLQQILNYNSLKFSRPPNFINVDLPEFGSALKGLSLDEVLTAIDEYYRGKFNFSRASEQLIEVLREYFLIGESNSKLVPIGSPSTVKSPRRPSRVKKSLQTETIPLLSPKPVRKSSERGISPKPIPIDRSPTYRLPSLPAESGRPMLEVGTLSIQTQLRRASINDAMSQK